MEKREKLEQVNRLVQKLGLSPQEVGEYLLSKDVKAPAVIQKYQTPAKVLPGMYVYADGLIYPEIIEGRQIKAVVGYVEDKTVYAVCLKQSKLPWSSDWLEARATQKTTDGKEATRNILDEARKTGKQAEAAQWCYDYAEDGVKQGEAFLSSLIELEKLFANKAAINASLKALGAALLKGGYWSSIKRNDSNAWIFHMYLGDRTWYYKNYYSYVRPVLVLKL